MLTLFGIPKPFRGHNKIIQRNAVKSWIQLHPQCEVILFGDDEGVAETAKEFHAVHVPDVEKTEFGTPLLSSAFHLAQQLAKNDILVYSNADIIFMPGLTRAVSSINRMPFLVCGRRWDVDITDELTFEDEQDYRRLESKRKSHGALHGPSGIDYFIFPRKLIAMPPFVVGRQGWDNWLIFHMRSMGVPVVDATSSITIIHQNHDFSHSKFGEKERVGGPELDHNIKLAGGYACLLSLRDADWILSVDGLRRPEFPRRVFSMLSLFYPWRFFLAMKRRLVR